MVRKCTGTHEPPDKPHKPCARHEAHNHIKLEMLPDETCDRERAPARCCLPCFIAVEHHSVSPAAAAASTVPPEPTSMLLCAPPRAQRGFSRTCFPVLCCAAARVPCSLHRPCRVPFLAPSQDGMTAFHFAAKNGHVAAMELLLAHGADPNAKDKVRAPLEALWLGKEGREGVRVQRCTRACHEYRNA